MANAILEQFGTSTAMTITTASLADGAGRQSTMIDNTSAKYPAAYIFVSIKMNTTTATTANSVIEVYLIRGDSTSPTIEDDNLGASDAAWSLPTTSGGPNATLIGTLREDASPATNDILSGSFYVEHLGPYWGIAVVNRTGQAFHATQPLGTNAVRYVGSNLQVQ